eukprot:2131282-Heterocapsa_arctica.AAC.1
MGGSPGAGWHPKRSGPAQPARWYTRWCSSWWCWAPVLPPRHASRRQAPPGAGCCVSRAASAAADRSPAQPVPVERNPSQPVVRRQAEVQRPRRT